MYKVIVSTFFLTFSTILLRISGRRSRRNSSSEDSQLTIENFGGSQDQLNAVGRFERERERDRERKLSNVSVGECEKKILK